MPNTEKNIYLTFDDGPHPQITPFVLDELDKYGAKATFFCIGKNVVQYPSVYAEILKRGHSVGNHTQHHLNGWKTKPGDYVGDVFMAREHIESDLFRPPYGRTTKKQHLELTQSEQPFHVIMWSVLSGDFDVRVSPAQCLDNVIKNAQSGAIVVFHDSDKAKERMCYCLPKVLAHFSELGYSFKKIDATALKKQAKD